VSRPSAQTVAARHGLITGGRPACGGASYGDLHSLGKRSAFSSHTVPGVLALRNTGSFMSPPAAPSLTEARAGVVAHNCAVRGRAPGHPRRHGLRCRFSPSQGTHPQTSSGSGTACSNSHRPEAQSETRSPGVPEAVSMSTMRGVPSVIMRHSTSPAAGEVSVQHHDVVIVDVDLAGGVQAVIPRPPLCPVPQPSAISLPGAARLRRQDPHTRTGARGARPRLVGPPRARL